ncbi:MAG: ABC transporter ATP-binding protein [Clostridiales bacterium]|nr:ABC transporter ATP-binding protein [Clostridiales bacterium]
MSLSIEHVTKKFGDFTALNNVSLEIQDGEFLAILGPSGCGKTTLLRIVGGFETPTEGSVKRGGGILSSPKENVPVEKRNIGMVFQSFALWPHMTVREHVQFPLNSRRCTMSKKEKQEAADQAITTVGLAGLEKRYPGELSGGQKQRVALARAIVAKPSILLMDEPLSALDAELKINMRQEIQNIHKLTGATIIYVTHDQSEALAMADRILIMKEGKIEQLGTPREVYCSPQTEFAATFVSKCNLVRGKWNGNEFHVRDQDVVFSAEPAAEEFLLKGICPIRPEEFEIFREKGGICGNIVNRQYNGREIHYTVQSGDDFYKVYTGQERLYCEGETIYLRKKVS